METTHFYSRLRRDFGRKTEFTDTGAEILEYVLTTRFFMGLMATDLPFVSLMPGNALFAPLSFAG